MSVHREPFWNSIEFIAVLRKCSCSRLAINGGMDATTFNKSKRYSKYGQTRWLSVGSLIRTLSGAGMTLLDFAVVYHVLCRCPKFSHPDQMKRIIQDVNSALQSSLARADDTPADTVARRQ